MADHDKPKTQVPNLALKARTLKRAGLTQADLIARAESVLDAMHGQMDQWMQEEIDALAAAFETWRQNPTDREDIKDLIRRNHDAKGQARTYGYPVIERLSRSFAQLLQLPPEKLASHTALVQQHVAAIRAAYREQVRDDKHPIADTLACELEQLVTALTNATLSR